MKQTDFTTVALAQTYSVQGVVTKNDAINHDAIFDVSSIMDSIMTDVNASNTLKKEARIYKSIMGGLLNEIRVFDATTQYALTDLVADGRYTQTMRDHVESLGKTYPFADATQATYDAELAKNLLYVDTPRTKTGYPQLDSSNTYAVILASKTVRLTSILDAVNTVDTVVTITAHTDDTDTDIFSDIGFKVATITIPAGSLSATTEIKKSLSRHCRFSSIADVVGGHNLIVKAL